MQIRHTKDPMDELKAFFESEGTSEVTQQIVER
jgi:hypothetical protein